MANFNRVILAGNLTRDPQLTYTPSGTTVCKFGMAINHVWTDRQTNEKREEVCFVDCTAFGRQGETINQYMSKGRQILIEGRLHFSQWTGQDGQNRSKLDVMVDRSQFLGSPGGAGGGAPGAQAYPAAAPPVGAPPVGAPPVGAPPVGAPPVGAPPAGPPPVAAPPVSAPPADAPPAYEEEPPGAQADVPF
ncbi:MAG: single-stranded DNA-binding protein [Phycisphaerae bacterium]|nr:single-stranded DNA-binding protein [Phycisphaerae bacterium]